MDRTLQRIATAKKTPEGDGMVVHRAFPGQEVGRIDPFLMLDEMGPIDFEPGARAGFPDHPHRGFETVTYMLEGAFQHKDSHGHAGKLGPGDVQWMTAGAGIVHSEMPHPDLRRTGGRLHGLQLWVNLPKADKMMRPRYQEIPGARIPEATFGGGSVKVLAGEFGGHAAVIDTRTAIQFLHVRLQPGGKVRLPVPQGHEGFLYCLEGSAQAGGKALAIHQLGVLGGTGDGLEAVAGLGGFEGVFVTGVRLNEPVFQYGPFVMTTRQEIVQAVEDFQTGKFGTIPAT
ncbi:MAG: quercetin 2,3-dioxygenase [Thermoplasmata archaeon]|jgi:redox-sensitive bicupin YhaK (pirin superfamily)|nr:quercetin 2,3-dioxygenase [Thermoplasmata archaeon]